MSKFKGMICAPNRSIIICLHCQCVHFIFIFLCSLNPEVSNRTRVLHCSDLYKWRTLIICYLFFFLGILAKCLMIIINLSMLSFFTLMTRHNWSLPLIRVGCVYVANCGRIRMTALHWWCRASIYSPEQIIQQILCHAISAFTTSGNSFQELAVCSQTPDPTTSTRVWLIMALAWYDTQDIFVL